MSGLDERELAHILVMFVLGTMKIPHTGVTFLNSFIDFFCGGGLKNKKGRKRKKMGGGIFLFNNKHLKLPIIIAI